MLNLSMDSPPSTSAVPSSAFSFLSKGWREVRASAGEDLQLIRTRANSFKNLADRELENFMNSTKNSEDLEFEFVKRIQPKISELRKVYSSPNFEFSSLVGLEKEKPRRRIRRKDWAKKEKEWELVKNFKLRLKEFEQKSQFDEIFGNFKSNELVEKVKLSLKSIYKEPQELKEVPPLDLNELLACLVRQSGPLFDQLGISRDVCDKVVESLCNKRKDPLICNSPALLENEIINDELDFRIASVRQSTGHHADSSVWASPSESNVIGDDKRHVAIVTTASLPWMTGTAVNPLFRAAYLAKTAKQNVTLLVPWLCKADQELVYPDSLTFTSPEEQEAYIRTWVEERVGFKSDFKISFYPGKFSKERRSILPAGDTSQFISSKEADIAILEEPEHLNWYHHGNRWTDKFNHVVGIVHTNYLEYIKREKNGALQAFMVKHINNWVARAYCHKILRLSGATQDLPRSTICNVHGVNPKFLKVGERIAEDKQHGEQSFSKGAYFLGKMVWAKGYRELIDLLATNKNSLDDFKLDVYGNGEDSLEVQSTAKKLDLNLNFLKGRDHADQSLHGYKVFINPSVSDVLCTATAEALAMGKFVICADHPSNDFFRSFPNCLTYKTPEDFVSKIREALSSEPQPLTPEHLYNLSWEAATERFIEYSELDKVLSDNQSNRSKNKFGNKAIKKSVSMPSLTEVVDGGLAFAHYCLTGNEILRLSTGAIPNSRDYDKQHSHDLHLLPPQVQNPIYTW